jgi:hypothetical protein
MYPAIVAPKLKICAAVAGAVVGSTKFFLLTPVATTKTRRDGIQTQFWYLQMQNVRKTLSVKSFLMWVKMLTS